LLEASAQHANRRSVPSHSEPIIVLGKNLEATRLDAIPSGRYVDHNTRKKLENEKMARQQREGVERTGFDESLGRVEKKEELRATGGLETRTGLKRSDGKADAEVKQRGREKKVEIWQCRSCTYANAPTRDMCEMCDSPRFE